MHGYLVSLLGLHITSVGLLLQGGAAKREGGRGGAVLGPGWGIFPRLFPHLTRYTPSEQVRTRMVICRPSLRSLASQATAAPSRQMRATEARKLLMAAILGRSPRRADKKRAIGRAHGLRVQLPLSLHGFREQDAARHVHWGLWVGNRLGSLRTLYHSKPARSACNLLLNLPPHTHSANCCYGLSS